MRQARYRYFLLPLLFVLACVGAFAQANSAISGIVSDQTGAVVAGAKIVVTDPATGVSHSTVSSSTGLYEVPGLNAANYDMKVTAKGFEAFEQKGIVVNISNTFRVDVKLTIGSETQTVTVQADALAVQSDSNVVSTLINEQQITDLPTNGRNIIALAALGLGVSGNLPDFQNPLSVNANFQISFNGLSQTHNIWLIDGGEAYDRGSGGKMSLMPSQDALGEFQVLASNYPPDYGYASGGTVSMSIKSGTSKFHGELYEFDRNDALNARNYFNPAPAKVQELRYNVYGGNVGGPVYIPGMYNTAKKKTFFFYNEEWRKEVTGQPTNPIQTVPGSDIVTAAADFHYQLEHNANPAEFCQTATYDASATNKFDCGTAYAPGVVYVPQVAATSRLGAAIAAYNTGKPAANQLVPGQPFPFVDNNLIPGSLLDPNALLFNATKNLPGSDNATKDTYVPSGGHNPVNIREDLFRIDHNINDKWQLFGHYIHDAEDSVQATPLWQSDSYPTIGSNFGNPAFGAVIKLTGSLTPNVLVEAAFNYDGNKIAIQPVSRVAAGFTKPSGWSTATYFPASTNALNRLPQITWNTLGTTWGAGNDPWTNGAEDFAEVGALSWTKGKHQMKFGGGFNRYTKNQIIGNNTEGNYTFNDGWATPTVDKPNQNQPTGTVLLTGDSYLDFLLGVTSSFSEPNKDPINHYVNNTPSIFAMDNWHATSRLSIQYGIRYDALPHVWERNNQVSNFDPSTYNPALAPVFDPASGAIVSTSPGLQTFGGLTYYMNGVVIAGSNGTPRGAVGNYWKTYQPRVGFSYDLTGNGKTILRGGFGTFFDRIQGNDIYDTAGKAPFIQQPNASNVEFTNTSFNWQSGGAASTPLFANSFTQSMSQYYPDPADAQFSLGVQREIVPSLILITQYVGNLAWHQQVNEHINNYPLSTPMMTRARAAGDLTNATLCPVKCSALSTLEGLQDVTYPGWKDIQVFTNPATGTYNSFQVGLRQQSRHGLSFEIDYTYSHQIDSTLLSQDTPNGNPSSNPWNLKYDKGSGTLDRRQVLNANYEYKIPLFAHSTGLAHRVIGGWEISGTFISEAGMPWNGATAPASGYPDSIGLGGGYTNRPDQIGKVVYPKKIDSTGVYRFFDNTAFAQPKNAWDGGRNLGFGNSGKDAVVGPGNTNFTTALYKSFAFTESMHVELRVDTFNTFNHTQFNALRTGLQNANYGEVSGARDPRVFELGGKFVF